MSEQPLHTVTTEPGDPWYTGALATSEQVDFALHVSLRGRGFLLDRAPEAIGGQRHSRVSIDLVNSQNAQDNQDSTGVQPEVWRRIADSWHMGAGQSRFDRPNALPYRFLDSRNVDVWSEWSMSLLPATEELVELPPGKVHLTTVGPDRFVAVVANGSWWWTDPGLPATTLALPSNVVDVTSDGVALYTLDVGGVIRRYTAPGVAPTVLGTVPNFSATRGFISYVKGFIVAAGSQHLYDVTSGTPNLIYQHPLSTFTWRDTADGLAPAYLLGGVGDKWSVYAMNINEDATGFDPPVAAAPVPEGEIGFALGSYLGYILIGTNAGWRFGVPSGDGTLTFGKLVETVAPVKCFEGQDRFVWYGQSGVGTRTAGLGRTDLGTFTSPATPAYANDLTTEVGGDVDGVITVGAGPAQAGKRVFAVAGQGLYIESDELCEDGWLEQGGMSFNSADPKAALYVSVDHAPLAGGKLTVQTKMDNQDWHTVAEQESANSVTTGKAQMDGRFRVLNIRYLLERGEDTAAGPQVERMEVRVLNVPGRATVFTLPLLLREAFYLEDRTVHRSAAEDYEFLLGLWESRERFTYREAGQLYEVRATDFAWLPEFETNDGSAYEGLLILTVKEIR